MSNKLELTEEELLEAKILSDPMYFAEAYLKSPADPKVDMLLRSYQQSILRNRSQNRVLRMGRRTGKTVVLAVEAIWKAFTNNDREILIVAGFDSQVQTVFNLINRMTKDSPEIAQSIERTRMRPYEIHFTNGSVIMGYVGNNSVRGKCFPADTIVIMGDLSTKQISDLKEGDVVKTVKVDEKGNPQMTAGLVSAVHNNGVQDIYELTTSTDRCIRATSNHKIATAYKGWMEMSDLKTMETVDRRGDFVGVVHPTGDLYWARVKQIKYIGKAATFDITVDPYHNFIAFNEMDEDKSGYKVNGSHSGGFLVHNSANDMYIDEVDSIPNDYLIEAVLPIATTYDDTTLTVSGTPSGRREYFYQVSRNKEKMGFKEHHIPSWESPQWTPEREESVKMVTTKSQFDREYGADFGSPAEGVFKNKFIDQNLYVYDYNELKYNSNNHYILGVDWNESTHGVQAIILEYMNTPEDLIPFNDGEWKTVEGDLISSTNRSRLLRVFFADAIDAMDYTNLGAVEFIIKLMKKFRFDYMAFDKGHGESNYEQLRLSLNTGKGPLGTKCPNMVYMLDRMMAVDMGGSTEIIDKVTGQATKALTKNVMVKNAQLINENGGYAIPAVNKKGVTIEDEESNLIGQMRGYIVERVGKTGEVYSSTVKDGLDHRLDAFLLATHAWMLQSSVFLKRDHATEAQEVEDFLPTNTAIPGWRRDMQENRVDIPMYTIDGVPVYNHGNYLRGEPPEVLPELKEQLTKSMHSKRSFKHSSRSLIKPGRKRRF